MPKGGVGISGAFMGKSSNRSRLLRKIKRSRARAIAIARGPAPLASRGFNFPMSRAEKKYFDIAPGTPAAPSVQVNTTGSFTLLNAPVPGTGYNNRIGRKIAVRSVYIRGYIAVEAALTSGSTLLLNAQSCRMILFIDWQPNGAAPAVTDLLVSANVADQINPNNRDRFKILADKVYKFDPYIVSTTATQSCASTNNQIYNIKKYKRMRLETIYNAGTAGTVADITTGALYLFFLGSNAAGANADSVAVFSTRVRYWDL